MSGVTGKGDDGEDMRKVTGSPAQQRQGAKDQMRVSVQEGGISPHQCSAS